MPGPRGCPRCRACQVTGDPERDVPGVDPAVRLERQRHVLEGPVHRERVGGCGRNRHARTEGGGRIEGRVLALRCLLGRPAHVRSVGAVGRVEALVAAQDVVAALAEERVVARTSRGSVVAVLGRDPVGSFTAIQAVVTVAAGEHVCAALAAESVEAVLPADGVVADPADDEVVPAAAAELVVAVAAAEHVVTQSALQLVDAGAAVDRVVAAASVELVVAAQAADRVRARRAADVVRTGGAVAHVGQAGLARLPRVPSRRSPSSRSRSRPPLRRTSRQKASRPPRQRRATRRRRRTRPVDASAGQGTRQTSRPSCNARTGGFPPTRPFIPQTRGNNKVSERDAHGISLTQRATLLPSELGRARAFSIIRPRAPPVRRSRCSRVARLCGTGRRGRGDRVRRSGEVDPLRRSGRGRRCRVVRSAASGGAAWRRDLERPDRRRQPTRACVDVWGRCRRLLQPQRHDGTERTELGKRPHRRPRIRASPRSLHTGRRNRRAERDQRLVASARHGTTPSTRQRRPQLRHRLEPQHRRDLRGGLRAARTAGLPSPDPLARVAERHRDRGAEGRPRPRAGAGDRRSPAAEAGRPDAERQLSPPGSAWRFRSDCSGPAATCR